MRTTFLILLLCTSSSLFSQGATGSFLEGNVSDRNSKEMLTGATIKAKHLPSGTQYNCTTDKEGNYHLTGLRVGGPYQVSFLYQGYRDIVYENVYLSLGETYSLDAALETSTSRLATMEVATDDHLLPGFIGTATVIHPEQIELMPTLNRNLADYIRLTPQLLNTADGGTAIAGMNNRYNAIYIDGAVNNDMFGLAASGANGGQVGVAPISIDAIEEIQVAISPYDVALGGFAGGAINAVTKSGTNELKGTAYWFSQNEGFAGETNASLLERTEGESLSLDAFSNTLYGLSLGGPIFKNKVFFFLNAELQREDMPVTFDINEYNGTADEGTLSLLSDYLESTYDYDPGAFDNKQNELAGTRIFGKLDFNLNNNNKLVLRHQYTQAERTTVNPSAPSLINFANNGFSVNSTTNSFATELNSALGTSATNDLIIGITSVRDDRDPLGGDFPTVLINDLGGGIRLGADELSTTNILEQNVVTVTNNFKLFRGKHTFTLGTHNEFSSFRYLFLRQNYGVYRFSSVESLISGENATRFSRTYALTDPVVGDESGAAADFQTMQLGFYLQDKWDMGRNFTLTYGVRLDIPSISGSPAIDPSFNTTTLPLLTAAYDLPPVAGGMLPDPQLMWSPRLGFQYDIHPKTRLRGGAGIFTSRLPFVWPSGSFVNNGLTIGSVLLLDQPFEADIQQQPTDPDFSTPSGQVDIFAQDFRYPQVLRASLAVDKVFWGIRASLKGVYTQTLNNIQYTNINTDPTEDFTWTGGKDERTVLTGGQLDPQYSAVYLISNTNQGSSYNVTTSFSKTFKNGITGYLAYNFADSESLIDGTSSQNSSQWDEGFNVDGRNTPSFGRSIFSGGSRVVGYLNYVKTWNKKKSNRTSISLFYEGRSGTPYSYVYGGLDARNPNNESGSTSRFRSLIWIPATASEINLADPSEWAALDEFIEQDDYLRENRGGYAEKNGARLPFASQLDLRIAQLFGIKTAKKTHKFEVSVDIFNLANLMSSSAGVVYDNPFAYRLIDFEGYEIDSTTPVFSFDEGRLGDERFAINDELSRWRMRLGVRYIFE